MEHTGQHSGTGKSSEELRRAGRDLRDSVTDTARTRAEQEYERRRAGANLQIEETAAALDESAERFRAHDQASLAQIAERGADMLSRLSDSIRDKSLEELGSDLQREARHHPALFVAGAVGLGFAMSRFLRASGSHRHDDYDEYVTGSSFGDGGERFEEEEYESATDLGTVGATSPEPGTPRTPEPGSHRTGTPGPASIGEGGRRTHPGSEPGRTPGAGEQPFPKT